MKHLFLIILLTISILADKDLRPGHTYNLCIQTAELSENTWYPLTETQKKNTIKLKLALFTKRRMILGGVMLEFTGNFGEVSFYQGTTKNGMVVTVGTEAYDKNILNVIIGDLHPKEFTCYPVRNYNENRTSNR